MLIGACEKAVVKLMSTRGYRSWKYAIWKYALQPIVAALTIVPIYIHPTLNLIYSSHSPISLLHIAPLT